MRIREHPRASSVDQPRSCQMSGTDSKSSVTVHLFGPSEISQRIAHGRDSEHSDFCESTPPHPSSDSRWLAVLANGLEHEPYLIQAEAGGRLLGELALAYVRSRLFGRHLVSLPYLNSGGVRTDDPFVAGLLIDRAVKLTEELDCRYLELRHERRCVHPALNQEMTAKVHMRLELPADADTLWTNLNAKVRNQVRKGQKQAFSVEWGRDALLDDFYSVFSHNMRDLGTPVYGRSLFEAILDQFGNDSEFCVIRDGESPIAAGLLVHGRTVTEVPSASSLRKYNSSNANMLMYWNLLQRSVDRGQEVFDFGRSSEGGPHYRFKMQWGSRPEPTVWQYHLRRGSIEDLRPDRGGNQRLVQIWRRLPVWVTRILGPPIVRGIP